MGEVTPVSRECDGGCGRKVAGYVDPDDPGERVLCGVCAEWEENVGD